MKLEIQANDFCPDNCPYCEPYKASIMDEYNITPTVEWGCENECHCRYVDMVRKGKDNKITHKTE